jgi:hypothetical protein
MDSSRSQEKEGGVIMSEVDYVAWATGAGANVYTPAVYQALSILTTGVEPGLADPQQANTTWRLASMTSAALANFISQQLGISVLDDGNLTNLIANLTSAVSVQSTVKPGRIVTSSATLNMLATDYAIGLNRSVPAAQVVNLPGSPQTNQEFRIADLVGNFNGDPITLTPPGGHTFAGAGTWLLNVNRGVWIVHYYGSSLWDIARCAS